MALRAGAMLLPAPFLWRPLGELLETVRTGEPAFPRIFGQRFFEYLASHPADAGVFNAAMTQGVAWSTPALLAAYDFSRFERLMDVGGGEGALLRDILAATPRLHGVLFDLSAVVATAGRILTGEIGWLWRFADDGHWRARSKRGRTALAACRHRFCDDPRHSYGGVCGDRVPSSLGMAS